MSSFAVDPTTLSALQEGLVGFAEELLNGSAAQRIDASGIASAGNDDGDPGFVISTFISAWTNSLAVTGQNISSVADRLGLAAQSYDAADDTVAGLSQQAITAYIGGAPGPSAPPPAGGSQPTSRQAIDAYTGA